MSIDVFTVDVVLSEGGPTGKTGAAARQDIVIPGTGGYVPGALELFYRSAGTQTFDQSRCSCEAATGGSVDRVWSMSLDGAPFATFTIHPDGSGTVAFAGEPTIPDGVLVRVTAPAVFDPALTFFTTTLRSA